MTLDLNCMNVLDSPSKMITVTYKLEIKLLRYFVLSCEYNSKFYLRQYYMKPRAPFQY